MIAISTILGAIIIVVAAILFVRLAKGTIVTVLAVAGVIIGLFLIFGISSIPNLGGYVNKETVQGIIPGTGSATYAPNEINITALDIDSSGNLVISLKNTGDLPLNDFEVIANEHVSVSITDTVTLAPGQNTSLHTNYKPNNRDVITVIAGGTSDGEIFISVSPDA